MWIHLQHRHIEYRPFSSCKIEKVKFVLTSIKYSKKLSNGSFCSQNSIVMFLCSCFSIKLRMNNYFHNCNCDEDWTCPVCDFVWVSFMYIFLCGFFSSSPIPAIQRTRTSLGYQLALIVTLNTIKISRGRTPAPDCPRLMLSSPPRPALLNLLTFSILINFLPARCFSQTIY